MGFDRPGFGGHSLPVGSVHAVPRPTPVPGWWLAGLALVLGAWSVLATRGGSAAAFGTLPWVLAPMVAGFGWARAAGSARARARAAFRLFAAAAAAGLLGQLAWAIEHDALAQRYGLAAAYLLSLPHLLITAGAALSLGSPRERASGKGTATDGLILLVAGVAVTLRVIVEPLLAARASAGMPLVILALMHAAAILPVVLVGILVLGRGSVLAPRAAAVLLAATIALGAGSLASMVGVLREPMEVPGPFDAFWLVGWVLYALAGLGARQLASTGRGMISGRRVHDFLRKLIVPGAALFLGAAVVDLGLRPSARPETLAAIALLGALVAYRTGHAFNLADRDAERRRQLRHHQTLLDVTHSLSEAPDLDATLRLVADAARSVFGTRGAGIELLSDDGSFLETRAVVGLPKHAVGRRFPVEGSFTGWVVTNGEPRASVDPLRDPYIRPESIDLVGPWPVAAAPIRYRDQDLGALFACIRTEPFDVEEMALLGALAEQAGVAIRNARLLEQVTILSMTDPLTGVANRRQLERELVREFAAAQRGRPLAAVMFDLDAFKEYNDAHGHLAGDDALRTFADVLRHETRAMNLAARYGGDEFVALVAGTGRAGAEAFTHRVRERFRKAAGRLAGEGLTVSAGIGVYTEGMRTPHDLLKVADAELYSAKSRVRM